MINVTGDFAVGGTRNSVVYVTGRGGSMINVNGDFVIDVTSDLVTNSRGGRDAVWLT